MLGIIIGVGAVITLVSVGRGAEASITSTYEQLGTNVLNVIPRSPEVEGIAGLSPVFATASLTLDDARALERIPSVVAIAPINENFISVTERTREIGIRKAVGAKRRDILIQFLFEAAMLSFTGGGIGIIGVGALSVLVSKIDLDGMTLQAVVSPDIVILAVSVSIIIGLVSGMYPAVRASRLNPIDALHYE